MADQVKPATVILQDFRRDPNFQGKTTKDISDACVLLAETVSCTKKTKDQQDRIETRPEEPE